MSSLLSEPTLVYEFVRRAVRDPMKQSLPLEKDSQLPPEENSLRCGKEHRDRSLRLFDVEAWRLAPRRRMIFVLHPPVPRISVRRKNLGTREDLRFLVVRVNGKDRAPETWRRSADAGSTSDRPSEGVANTNLEIAPGRTARSVAILPAI